MLDDHFAVAVAVAIAIAIAVAVAVVAFELLQAMTIYSIRPFSLLFEEKKSNYLL